jgi:large subunit ribosomal protein L23
MLKSNMYDIIKCPIITEKSAMMGEAGKYVFEVLKSADKAAVKKAVQEIFGVKVTKVNMLNVKGKVKRFRGTKGKLPDRKKAIVTLADKQEIDLTGGVK